MFVWHKRNRFFKGAAGAIGALSLLAASACGTSGSGDEVTLRLSHQWPKPKGDDGDFRSLTAEKFADLVDEKTNGKVNVKIYTDSSLVDSKEQYQAIKRGTLDMSVYPLDYAAGEVPQFSVTLMPALVKSHQQAQNWQGSDIGTKVEEIAEDNGLKILTWIWNAGGIGVKDGDPIITPDDVNKGDVVRAAGPWVERMLKATGFSITSMASSEIYSAMQTGALDVAVTSAGSFRSYRLHEQTDSYTSPTENTFWFMFEPLVIGTEQLDKLSSKEQDAIIEAGEELQDYVYKASEEDDGKTEKVFKDAGVDVAQIDDDAFDKWQEASKPIWEQFGKDVKGGQELIDLALEVPTD